MQNTIRNTGITARTRFALLALGAISLSTAVASPASAQAVTPNASGCRSSIGIAVSRACLSAKPEDHGAARDRSNAGGGGGGYTPTKADAKDTADIARQNALNEANKEKYGRDDSPFGGRGSPPGYTIDRDGTYHPWYPANYPSRGGVKTTQGGGGNGGAPGQKGSRIAAPLPGDARTSASVAPPKAAVPKSTTVDKVANTTTRDYRTGATAATGGPPPAAAIGTKPTASQMTAQSGVRDHRHPM
jgi:hypothetical protein